jgi:hypothetical protein
MYHHDVNCHAAGGSEPANIFKAKHRLFEHFSVSMYRIEAAIRSAVHFLSRALRLATRRVKRS